MVLRQRVARRPFGLPPSGSRAIFVGDSISDPTLATAYNGAKYAVILANTYGWRVAGVNAIPNANFETDATGWVAAGATIASDTARAQFGTRSMKITPSAVNLNIAPEGDVGAIRLGMRPGQAWTFSAYVWVPVGTAGSYNLQLYDFAGSYAASSTPITAQNAWQRVSVSRTILAGATESFARITGIGVTVGQAVWVDGAMLEPNGSMGATFVDSPRAANAMVGLGGTTLVGAASGGTAQNFSDNLATRYTPHLPADVVCMMYGANDIGLGGAGGLTRDGWRQAVTNAVLTFQSQAPSPLVVVCSLGWLTAFVGDATAVAGWGVGSTRGAVYSDMNAITKQVARDLGAAWVDLSSMVAGDTLDGLHPTQAGHDKIVTAFKNVFGQ